MVERVGDLRDLTPGVVGLDIETTGLHTGTARLEVLTISDGGRAVLIELHGEKICRSVVDFLAGCAAVVTHNGTNFDIPILLRHGLSERDLYRIQWRDTLTESRLLHPSEFRHDLATVTRRVLGVELNKEVDHQWGGTLSERQIEYALNDAAVLPALFKAMPDTPRTKLERALLPVVAQMASNGVPIDVDRFTRESAAWVREANELRVMFESKWGCNPLSPKQLTRVVSSLHPGVVSTSEEALAPLRGSLIVDDILAYRRAAKLAAYNTEWLNEHAPDGVLHPSWWSTGTATGRFSASNPNAQQLPPPVRRCVGGAGILSVDYSQIEIRVAAHLAGDDGLINALATGDVHTSVARQLFNTETPTKEQRQAAKAVTFALLYGGTPATIRRHALSYGVVLDNPEELYRRFFSTYTKMAATRRKAQQLANTPRLVIPLPVGERVLRGEEVTATRILNTRVQGTAAAGLKFALLRLPPAARAKLIAQVHDELLFACDTDEVDELSACAAEAMIAGMQEACPGMEVAVDSEYGSHWVV